ncbi:MAG: tetratricopeptide repeat protein, partial [Myxococcota bacterium]
MAIKRDKVLAAARKHWSKGHWERALREYEKLVEHNPRDVTSLQRIAQAQIRLGRPAKGQEAYYQLAIHHLQDEYYDKAAAFFKMAIDIEGAPRKPELHWSLGESYHKMGRLKEALIELNQANNIYRDLGDARSQQAALEYMLRLDPENNNLRIQLAERYVKDGLKEEAVRLFHYAAGRFEEEGRIDDYLRVLERLIFLDPSRIGLRLRAAQLHVRQLNYKRALKLLKVLYQQQPEDIEVLRLLSHTFEQLDQRPKAIMVYKALAMSYRRQQDNQRAMQIYEHILRLDPKDAEARQHVRPLQADPESSASLLGRSGAPGNIGRKQPPKPEGAAMAGVEFLDEDLGAIFEDLNATAELEAAPQNHRAPQPSGQALAPSDTLDDIEDFEDFEDLSGDIDFGKFQAMPGESGPAPSSSASLKQDVQPSANLWGRRATTTHAQPEEDLPELEVEELLELEVEDLLELEDMPELAEFATHETIEHSIEESRIFSKYGLLDKAVASIRELVRSNPHSIPARERMRALYLETRQPLLAGEQCIEMAKLAHASGQNERAVELLYEAERLTQNTNMVHAIAQQLGVALGDEGQALGSADSQQGLDIPTDDILQDLEDGDLLELDASEMISLEEVEVIPQDTDVDRIVPFVLPESPTDEYDFGGEFEFSDEDADMMFDNLFGGEPSTPSGIGKNSLTNFSNTEQNRSEFDPSLRDSNGHRTLDTGGLRASASFGERSLSQRYDYEGVVEFEEAELDTSMPSLAMVDDSMNTSYELGLTYLQME